MERYFVDRPEGVGGDDHEPFLRAGVPMQLISFNSMATTTGTHAEDTIDKVSAAEYEDCGRNCDRQPAAR